VQLLTEGRKVEAGALMASDGDNTKTSDQLMAAMAKWKDSVHKTREKTFLHQSKML
jgi:hypothetical protein